MKHEAGSTAGKHEAGRKKKEERNRKHAAGRKKEEIRSEECGV
ncbi:hypothetical protein [Ulvibacter antarcticus]|nr:hypothetical protein [Ulvibacter antarcticus]